MTFASASMGGRFTSRIRPWKRGTANRQMLRSLRERFGAEVFYAGAGEKADFAAALARETGSPDDPLLGRLGLAHAGRDWVRLEFPAPGPIGRRPVAGLKQRADAAGGRSRATFTRFQPGACRERLRPTALPPRPAAGRRVAAAGTRVRLPLGGKLPGDDQASERLYWRWDSPSWPQSSLWRWYLFSASTRQPVSSV
jgi:hypothetical protein